MSKQYTQIPAGYRVEYKPADPVFMSPMDFARDVRAGFDGGAVWPLFPEPQPGCPEDVDVYRGWCWVQPKYVSAVSGIGGFTPLYRGPQIQDATIDEMVAFVFPSLVEPPLTKKDTP